MGYTEKDWLAINTIRTLAVCFILHSFLVLNSINSISVTSIETPHPAPLYPAIVNITAKLFRFFLLALAFPQQRSHT